MLVTLPCSSTRIQQLTGQLSSKCLTHSLLCFPRLCASGLSRRSLHPGSAFSASYSGARVQTEAQRPFQKTYVSPMMRPNKHANALISTSSFILNINLPYWVPHNPLSNTYFLSVRWINCISHSRKHIHTLVFRCVSIHSQWPVSRFLFARWTRAGEDGQVSFPTRCHLL